MANEDLDHLHHARRQFVAALKLFDLILEALLQIAYRFAFEYAPDRLDILGVLVVLDGNLPPLSAGVVFQHLLGHPVPPARPFGPP